MLIKDKQKEIESCLTMQTLYNTVIYSIKLVKACKIRQYCLEPEWFGSLQWRICYMK